MDPSRTVGNIVMVGTLKSYEPVKGESMVASNFACYLHPQVVTRAKKQTGNYAILLWGIKRNNRGNITPFVIKSMVYKQARPLAQVGVQSPMPTLHPSPPTL